MSSQCIPVRHTCFWSSGYHILYDCLIVKEVLNIWSGWKWHCPHVLLKTFLLGMKILLSVTSVQRKTAGVLGVVQANRSQELDRVLIQQLRDRCEQQALQLQSLQAHLKKASLCLDVFSITTQHFCHKVGYGRPLGPQLGRQTSRHASNCTLSVKIFQSFSVKIIKQTFPLRSVRHLRFGRIALVQYAKCLLALNSK